MPASQKRLMLLLAGVLVFQAAVTLISYSMGVARGAAFGGDFAVFWQAAQKLATGAANTLYDTSVLTQLLEGKLASDVLVTPFVYPPPMALLLWPLGYTSYNIAVTLWSLLPLIAFYWLLRAILRYSEKDGQSLFKLAVPFTLPFVMANLFTGQTGTLLACFFLAGLYGWQRKRAWTGVAFGLMIIKPQLGVLIPFALIATRQWRIMAVATATVLVLVLLSTLLLGTAIWRDYAAILPVFSRFAHEKFAAYAALVASPYMSLQLMGAPLFIAAWAQATVSLFVLLVVMNLFAHPKQGSPCLRFGLLACGMLLVTPHCMVYDTPLLAIATATMFMTAWRKGWADSFEMLAFVAILLMPFLQPMLMQYGIAISWLFLLVFFAAILRRYRMEFQPFA